MKGLVVCPTVLVVSITGLFSTDEIKMSGARLSSVTLLMLALIELCYVFMSAID